MTVHFSYAAKLAYVQPAYFATENTLSNVFLLQYFRHTLDDGWFLAPTLLHFLKSNHFQREKKNQKCTSKPKPKLDCFPVERNTDDLSHFS